MKQNNVISLVKLDYTTDANGNQIASETVTQVFALPASIGTGEFYAAATTSLRPTAKFVIADCLDYSNQQVIRYTPFQGTETEYTVIRTYQKGNSLELTCELKVHNG